MDKKKKFQFGMFLVTIGIVYGDIGTSPMYVMKSILEGNGGIANTDQQFIIGSLSLIIWTVTLLTTVKYVLIALRADHHGEGGIFALYSLVKSCGKWLIFPAMLGGAALLADGVLTPAVTVTTAVEGLRSMESMDAFLGESNLKVVIITLVIISCLFIIQQAGTSKIGKAFGPVMLIWFGFLGVTGLLRAIQLPVVLKALNPVYAVLLLVSPYNKAGFMILGSVFLATTGAEALYSDMGHVGRENIYFSWPFVKICLILNYFGQGAWIIQNQSNAAMASIADLNPFFMMLPEGLRPVAVLLSTAAAIIASQALITGSYTLVAEAINLDMLPHLEIRYPSETKGQLYIGTVNKLLWIGCTIVVLYFRSGAKMEAAYGLAITVTMLMTTLLISIYLWNVRHQPVLAAPVLLVFGIIEAVFFVSSLGKFTHGGYFTVILTLIILAIMVIWRRGTALEGKFITRLKLRDHVDTLGKLRNDDTVPMLAHNLVYIDSGDDMEYIDRDILYSVLDKDNKRAMAYWFINVNILNDPDTMSYQVETFGTDYVFRVRLNLGFKCDNKINIYLRQIVHDLQESGDLPAQEKKYSIYGPSGVGTFKFGIIHKSVITKTDMGSFERFFLNAKTALAKAASNKVKWYGLENSTLIQETVPLIVNTSISDHDIKRI